MSRIAAVTEDRMYYANVSSLLHAPYELRKRATGQVKEIRILFSGIAK